MPSEAAIDATAVLVEGRLHVGEEFIDVESALGQVDEMRPVVGKFARQRRGGGEEAGVAAHDDRDIDARQRGVVEVGAHEGLGDEARRRGEARRVVEADEVVVDGLGDVDGADRIAGLVRLFGHDPAPCRRNRCRRCRRNVSISCARRTRKISWQYLRSGLSRVEPSAAAGRDRHRLQVDGRLAGEIDKILVDDAAHAMDGAVDMGDRGIAARLQRDADQRLIDDGRRAAPLRDQDFMRHFGTSPRSATTRFIPGRL